MEISSLHKSVLGESVKEENKASISNGEDKSFGEKIVLQVGAGKNAQGMKAESPDQKNLNQGPSVTNTERPSPESESRSSSSAKREQVDDQFESIQAEMAGIMEENQRLKLYLDRILKDYRALQMQYQDVIQQEDKNTPNSDPTRHDHKQDPDELIALSLGISSRDRIIKGDVRKTGPISENITMEGELDKEGLTLGLDCKFDAPKKLQVEHPPNASPENRAGKVKEEAGETWRPKTMKNVSEGEGIDEISQQNPAKRARVSVRVRCNTPTMNDGCQWRKYGQKIAKGNPCPRAYYRCTVAPSCPVRKQVQRCAEDMSILVTTYEGTHNHPLPMSATAMASTTSAAASMLMSGSSTSGTGPFSSSSTAAAAVNLNGLNFDLCDNSRTKPFYLPNSSILSSSPSNPTISIDLTSNSSSSSAHLTRLGNTFPSRYSTTNLNFSSLESPMTWSSGMLSYGPQPYNNNQTPGSLNFAAQHNEALYQSHLHKIIPNHSQQSVATDTIAAATKAITSDPNFPSALAAAIKSIIGSGSTLANQNAGENPGHVIGDKATQSFPILSSFPWTSNANKCAPSYLNK